MQSALEGKFINFTNKMGINWVCSGENIAFDWANFDYNIYEEPKTKPSINWEHVSKDFNYMATDEDGRSYLYKSIPTLKSIIWYDSDGEHGYADVFSSFVPGTCDWKDSLVWRPAGE